MKWGPAFALFLFFVPLGVSALAQIPTTSPQVVINEIMYNPEGSDSGREWVELYNPSDSDVALIGGSGKDSWRIGDSSNHTLTDPSDGTGRGSLFIPAGGYLVVASDPNEFISGEYAGGSYSVVKSSISLNNTGTTVSLLDGTGALVDSVAYTSAQGASDDGSSLQKQPDGSWIAALPTPGAENSTTPYIPPPPDTDSSGDSQTSDASSSSQTHTPTNPTSSYVPPPQPNLFTDAGEDETVIVGADAEFDASAYDKTQTLLDPTTVRFSWNFGDGVTAEGPAVLHHFSYPGRYAVVVNIASAKNSAEDEITVTAEPAALQFSLLQDGGVSIENLAGHDLDLSEWIVRQNESAFSPQFILPAHSEVLSGSALRMAGSTLTFRASSSTLLEYPNGVFAFAIGTAPTSTPPTLEQTKEAAPAAPKAAGAAPAAIRAPETAIDTSASTDTEETDVGSILEDVPPISSTQETAAAAVPTSNYLWWIGAILLALAACGAAIAFTRIKSGEWDIIEDSSE